MRKEDIINGIGDNPFDMGYSHSEWESMFELMETNQEDYFNFQSFVQGVSAYQRGINQTKIRETFHQIDVTGEGFLQMDSMRQILQNEIHNGESGASIDEEA